MGVADVERIALRRAVAAITADRIVVRPSRAQLLGPVIQLGLTALAVALIVLFLDRLPFAVVVVLTVVAIFLGPVASLGFVFAVFGSSMVVDRRKQSAHWQQGFLGLGIGTTTSVPFGRIGHVAVTGDYDEEDIGGRGHDFVTWDVELVRDDGRRHAIGSVIAARPLAGVGLDRANRLAEAVGAMAAAGTSLGVLPDVEDELTDEPIEERDAGGELPPRRRRRVRRATLPPPEGGSS